MKSSSTIAMDFQKAKKQAEQLEEIAREMRQLANNDLEGSLQCLSEAWRGEAAELYCRKGEALREKILDSASKLEQQAGVIRSTAKRTYDAEMAAHNLAKTRLYNK